MQKIEYSKSDYKEEDNDEDISDEPSLNNAPISVGKHREESEHLSAVPRTTEGDHNVHQSRDVNRHKIPEVSV